MIMTVKTLLADSVINLRILFLKIWDCLSSIYLDQEYSIVYDWQEEIYF